ncbi:MAG: prepilin-type N-terminal cleavage/methylation domain-containing protein [Patescibacteria group bacterium]|nr:prepilin-type N-terminal cleavage/methylation domain-containing protein [Patescibacteria group bacterium]
MTKRKIMLVKKQNGFTLIESLITILVMSILFLGVYELIIFSIKITNDNKHRMAATIISNQKMEIIRNLPYNDIGTVSGMVNGVIQNNEIVQQGGNIFNINTFVKYEDDAFDGISTTEGGTDTIPTDYKSVRIRVSWTGGFQEKNVVAYTIISQRGIETSAGGGTLAILVYDANGLPVNSADVLVQNNIVAPVIDFSAQTNAQGKLIFYGAPTSTEAYRITVSKTGYSVSSTTDRTLENPNPTKPHASVIEDWKTEITFYIDKVSNLNITTIKQDLLDNWLINTDGSGENQIHPDFAVDPLGNLYFVWEDYSNTSDSKIYSQKYDLTPVKLWAVDKIVSSANKQINPSIASDSVGNFYITWNDDRNGNQDSYLIKTDSDGNDLWTGDKKINTDAGNEDQINPQVAISKIDTTATSTVVWQDNRNSNWDIYAQRFDSDGNNLWTNDLKANNDGATTDQHSPTLAIDSTDNIYVIWTDERNGNKDIYAQKYDASGSKLWGASDLKVNNDGTATDQYSANIAIDSSNNIYIVWTDERNSNKDIYIQKYDASGSKLWGASDLKANNDGTLTNQHSPDLAIDSSDNIYIIWTDERNGNKDIYAQKYDSDGNKLWTNDLRVNINVGNSDQDNPEIIINPFDGKAYACWQDNRDGNYDVYASPVEPYGSISYIANVPVTITGAKKIGENPIIYKYTVDQTSDSNGEINLVNIEWDSYTVELQTGYSGHSIIMSDPSIPINLLPDETQELILYLE